MKRFKKIYIEITNICNLSCNFCPKTKRKLKFLDEDSFTYIVKAVKPYTDHIYFHLMGEPLLHPQLGRFLKISNEHGLMVNMTTNGTLINQAKDILIHSPALRKMNISLSSFEANEPMDNLKKYIDDIINFILEATEKTNKIFSLRLWNMDNAEHKPSNKLNGDILKMLEQLGPDFNLSEKLNKSHHIKLKNNVYLNMAEQFDWPDMDKSTTYESIFCYGLRDQIGILVDGTVVPCCLDSEGNIPLGNIFKTSIAEILASERAKKLYDGFTKRCAVEELCNKCGYAKRF